MGGAPSERHLDRRAARASVRQLDPDLDAAPTGATSTTSTSPPTARRSSPRSRRSAGARRCGRCSSRHSRRATRARSRSTTSAPRSRPASCSRPTAAGCYGSSYYTGVSNIFRYDLRRRLDGRRQQRGDRLLPPRAAGQRFADRVPLLGRRLRAREDRSEPAHGRERRHVPRGPARAEASGAEIVARAATVAHRAGHGDDREGPYPRARAASGSRRSTRWSRATRSARHSGVRANASDPFRCTRIEGTLTVLTPRPRCRRALASTRLGYKHSNTRPRFATTAPRSTTSSGQIKRAAKVTADNINWSRNLMHDAPRTLDLGVSVSGFGGLERLPENQNVATSPGFDLLVGLAGRPLVLEPALLDRRRRSREGLEGRHRGRGEGRPLRASRRGEVAWVPARRRERSTWARRCRSATSSLWLRTAAGKAFGRRDDPFANYFFGGFGNN